MESLKKKTNPEVNGGLNSYRGEKVYEYWQVLVAVGGGGKERKKQEDFPHPTCSRREPAEYSSSSSSRRCVL